MEGGEGVKRRKEENEGGKMEYKRETRMKGGKWREEG